MKTLLKTFIVLSVIAATASGGAWWWTGKLVGVADSFLAASSRGDYVWAHAHLAQAAQRQTPQQKLAAFAQQLGLDQYRESNWGNRKITGSQGSLEGRITTRDGRTVPLTLSFVKEPAGWKILAIRSPQPGVRAPET